MLRKFKKPKGEIKTLSAIFRKMNPKEIKSYLHDRFMKDMKVYSRLVKEQEDTYKWLRNQPDIRPILEKINIFYADLVTDGHVNKDLTLFEQDEIEEWKFGQSREEYTEILDNLKKKNRKNYFEIFRQLNRAYVVNYETIIDIYLKELAQKIVGKKIRNKGQVLNALNLYRDGKHTNIFRSLIPQIRNSIQHQDFIIDPKQEKITFYDRKKQPLFLTMKEYTDIFWESFLLSLTFDVADFDLKKGIIRYLLDAINTVDEFLKAREIEISEVDRGKLSILDMALLIKAGKLH